MADAFVSYRRSERARCWTIIEGLRSHGYEVWFDAHIEGGEAFPDVIDREVRAAKAVIVLWSPAARESHWVKAEAYIGFGANRLVSILLEPTDLPVPFNTVHAFDLSQWRGDTSDPDWQAMVRRVARLTDKAALLVVTPTRASEIVRITAVDAVDANIQDPERAANQSEPLSRERKNVNSTEVQQPVEELKEHHAPLTTATPTAPTAAAQASTDLAPVEPPPLESPSISLAELPLISTDSPPSVLRGPESNEDADCLDETIVSAEATNSPPRQLSRRAMAAGGIAAAAVVLSSTRPWKSLFAHDPSNADTEPAGAEETPYDAGTTSKSKVTIEAGTAVLSTSRAAATDSTTAATPLTLAETAVIPGLRAPIFAMTVSPDGTHAAVLGDSVQLWDLVARKRLPADLRSRMDYCLAFSAASDRLAVAGFRACRLYDVQSQREMWFTRNTTIWWDIDSIAFSPSGKHIALVGRPHDKTKVATLVDATNGRIVSTFVSRKSTASQCTFAHNGELLVTGPDGDIVIWRVKDQKEVRRVSVDTRHWFQLTADESHIIVATDKSGNAQFKRSVKVLKFPDLTEHITFDADCNIASAILADKGGDVLLVKDDKHEAVHMFDWRRGVKIGAIALHTDFEMAAFSDRRVLLGAELVRVYEFSGELA